MGELFSDRNGDGVLREENTMLPMLTIAHMQVDADAERFRREA